MKQPGSIPKGYGIVTFPQTAAAPLHELFPKPTAFINTFIEHNKSTIPTVIPISLSLSLSLCDDDDDESVWNSKAKPWLLMISQKKKNLDISNEIA